MDAPTVQYRRKALEGSIIRQVELSVLAAGAGKQDIALARANKAQESLDLLRACQLQEHRSGSSMSNNSAKRGEDSKETLPMTTEVNLFDLMLMVKSNMATRMKEVGRYEEALDIYTQLCRLASNPGDSGLAGFKPPVGGSGHQEVKNLLYKFGMNIGNVLFEMRDYQRALKYYRLTLDRLSSSGYRNFRIKLMSNISVTLMMLHSSMPASSDHLTSLNLLLSDNVGQSFNSEPSNQQIDVCNANHFKFGLNLLVAQYERKDLRAMLNTFKTLVGTNISQHYTRALQIPQCRPERKLDSTIDELIGFKQDIAIVASDKIRSGGSSTLENSTRALDEADSDGEVSTIKLPLSEQRAKLVMRSIRDDSLEISIHNREEETRRALVSACGLILDLGHNLKYTGDNDALMMQTLVDENSAASHCVKLLASSARYKTLVFDVKINSIARSLSRRHRLRKSIEMLQGLERERQEYKKNLSEAGKQKSKLIDSGLIGSSKVAPIGTNQVHPIRESTSIGTNLSLVQMFSGVSQSTNAVAIKLALKSEPLNADCWVNMACCYAELGDLERATACLRQALALDARHWSANYNLILISRKASQQIDWPRIWNGHLFSGTSNDFRQSVLISLIYQGLVLEIVQILLAIQQTGTLSEKSSSILKGLLNSPKRQSPEVYLLLSKLLSENSVPSDTDLKATSMSVIQLGSRIHPYHIPLAERLIALHISLFDYQAAENTIKNCTKIRPDQVKWYRVLAECYLRASDYKRAIDVYKYAVSLFPLDTSCLKALAKLTKELGLIEEYESCQVKIARASKLST